MENKFFMFVKTAIALILSAICIASQAQEGVLSNTATEKKSNNLTAPKNTEKHRNHIYEIDIYRAIVSENTFQISEENTYSNMRTPTSPGIHFKVRGNYYFSAFYWNGQTSSNSGGCFQDAPDTYWFQLFRNGVLYKSYEPGYGDWGAPYQESPSLGQTIWYCGSHLLEENFGFSLPEGTYSLYFLIGNQVVDTEALFTVDASSFCNNIQTVPLYAAIDWTTTNFYLTTNPDYMNFVGPGYQDLGVIAKTPVSVDPNIQTFNSLYNPTATAHAYTINPNEIDFLEANGWSKSDSQSGYIFNRQMLGTIPLYRGDYQNGGDWMFFYTTDASFLQNIPAGWSYGGIAGYVCPAQ